MDDLREKVLRGLKHCASGVCELEKDNCPYFIKAGEIKVCTCNLCADVLALLKAQERIIAALESAEISYNGTIRMSPAARDRILEILRGGE